MERVQEVRGVVRAADVDSLSLIFCFFNEVGHFCELGGSRESRKPFRRKAGAKHFTSRPGALRAPRGRPDLKNDRLLNLLACDKIVAEAVLRKPLKVCGMRAMHLEIYCRGRISNLPSPMASARLYLEIYCGICAECEICYFGVWAAPEATKGVSQRCVA